MNSILFGFSVLVSLAALGLHIVYRRTGAKSATRIHELESAFATLRTERDITEKTLKQIQGDELVRYLAGHIITHMSEGIIYIDEHRVVRLVNAYAELLLGTFPLGKPYHEAVPVQRKGVSDFSLFDAAFVGKPQTMSDDYALATARGIIPITGSIFPLPIAGSGGAVVFAFTDNSQHTARLKDEQVFFSQMTHELRTPLTAIRVTAALLREKFDALGKDKVIEHLRSLDETSEYLVYMINNLLNISRIDQGRLEVVLRPFDMVKLTEEVVRELTPLAKSRKLFITHEPIDGEYRSVIGDSLKAKEVLTNLIGNGIKYTIRGGLTITHKVSSTALATSITDMGSGIPVQNQNLLFKRFSQIGSARKQDSAKGSGLGLYISKKFAQLMHGDVQLESSEPGKGSTFTFTLPLS